MIGWLLLFVNGALCYVNVYFKSWHSATLSFLVFLTVLMVIHARWPK